MAVRNIREAAALVDPESFDAMELEAIATALLNAEDHTTLPRTGAEPDYALAFRGIEVALARLNTYIASREVAEPDVP